MFVGAQPAGLTEIDGSGKKSGAAGSQQRMTTHQARAGGTLQSVEPAVDVVAWRARRLQEAGFAGPLAIALAHQPVDLHALLELVDSGCPPDLAARILSPLEVEVSW